MLTYSAEITNLELLDGYARLFAQAPQLMTVLAHKVVDRYGDQLKAALSAEPPPARYPILWTSWRQEVAFYASNGFGRGIPTNRTHDTARRTNVIITAATDALPASIGVESPTPYDKFVRGYAQQEFHRRTGWVKTDDAVAQTQQAMANEFGVVLQQAFEVVGKR